MDIEIDEKLRVWSLPEFHNKERFDKMYLEAKKEYPHELDYILHMATLSCLIEEDEINRLKLKANINSKKINRIKKTYRINR